MVNHQLVLPKPNANIIWRFAWCSFFTSIYALSRPDTIYFSIIPACVFATSLNYWRDPVRESWRRKTDMLVVYSSILSQSVYVYLYVTDQTVIQYNHSYFYLIFTSVMCYLVSEYYLQRGRIWPATYFHACIHIIANIANIVVCEGVVRMHYEVRRYST
jgi:hypothetical protein